MKPRFYWLPILIDRRSPRYPCRSNALLRPQCDECGTDVVLSAPAHPRLAELAWAQMDLGMHCSRVGSLDDQISYASSPTSNMRSRRIRAIVEPTTCELGIRPITRESRSFIHIRDPGCYHNPTELLRSLSPETAERALIHFRSCTETGVHATASGAALEPLVQEKFNREGMEGLGGSGSDQSGVGGCGFSVGRLM